MDKDAAMEGNTTVEYERELITELLMEPLELETLVSDYATCIDDETTTLTIYAQCV